MSKRQSTEVVMGGTDIKKIGPVAICSIKPEYRDCLDQVMDEWKKHRRSLPKKLGGKRYVPGIYGFAYWLIRWSGLVEPTKHLPPPHG